MASRRGDETDEHRFGKKTNGNIGRRAREVKGASEFQQKATKGTKDSNSADFLSMGATGQWVTARWALMGCYCNRLSQGCALGFRVMDLQPQQRYCVSRRILLLLRLRLGRLGRHG
jgi:hypothetical protein